MVLTKMTNLDRDRHLNEPNHPGLNPTVINALAELVKADAIIATSAFGVAAEAGFNSYQGDRARLLHELGYLVDVE